MRGALRLTQPLDLEEGAVVEVLVMTDVVSPTTRTPGEILAEIAELPLKPSQNEFTAREHDRVLYGEKEKA
jgi:hypothetical protein